MEVRTPQSDQDFTLLAEINHRLIHDEGHRNAMNVPRLRIRMMEWLDNGYEAAIFRDGVASIGYALWRNDPEYIYLRQFFIEPDHRRRGFGRSAISWLQQNRWLDGRVRVEVLVGNKAGLSFWRAVGFDDYCITLEL